MTSLSALRTSVISPVLFVSNSPSAQVFLSVPFVANPVAVPPFIAYFKLVVASLLKYALTHTFSQFFTLNVSVQLLLSFQCDSVIQPPLPEPVLLYPTQFRFLISGTASRE